MKRFDTSVLGLFPPLSLDSVGGVQTSGRVAWEGIAGMGSGGAAPRWQDAILFCCGKKRGRGSRNGDGPGLEGYSKTEAVIQAVSARWSARLVLVWHVALLKLLPLFRVSDARIVVFLHGVEAWRRQDLLTRVLLRRVDLFLSNSEYTWERFVAFNAPAHVGSHRAVHLGIGSPVRVPIRSPGQVPAVLMLGRLLRSEDYKGHRELIAAWPLVLERTPSAELWIAGDGDLRRDLERMVDKLGLSRAVRFWGHVSEPRKEDLLAQCRCLALPSRGEGFGLVYLEAMRLGRPCLVSSVDAGREVVNPPEAGLAVDPGNRSQLAEATCRLLSLGPEWERWSEQARRRYERCFTATRFQQRLVGALSDAEKPMLVA